MKSSKNIKRSEHPAIQTRYPPEDLGKTYVICAICGLYAKSLGKHVSQAHGITSSTYKKKYGQVICEESKRRYSETKNYDWISRANNSGKDLTAYAQKMGTSLSKSILRNASERERRSNLMAELNRRDDFRERSRQCVIKNQIRKGSLWGSSKDEFELYNAIKEKFPSIKHRVQLEKWIMDFFLEESDVYLQFDGEYWHGLDRSRSLIECSGSKRDRVILGSMERDKNQNEWFILKGRRLVRMTDREFRNNRGRCMDTLFMCLNNALQGVTFIGTAYSRVLKPRAGYHFF